MLGAGVTGPKAEGSARPVVSLLQAGDHWRFEFFGQTFYIRDSKGVRYLLLLTENPGRKFSLEQVAAAGEAMDDAGAQLPAPEEVFRNRLREIRSEMQVAEDWNDLGRRLWMQMEVERMSEELEGPAVALDKKQAESAERARKSVGNSVRRTIGGIAKFCPLLAAHLNVSVRTGGSLAYVPDPLTGIRWRRERILERLQRDVGTV